MNNIVNTINERVLKETIIDIVNDNEDLRQENRRLEDKLASRPINIFVDKNGYLLFIETEWHKKVDFKRYNDIYNYFKKKELIHSFYCDGIPVIQIDLSKRMIYRLMKRGVI